MLQKPWTVITNEGQTTTVLADNFSIAGEYVIFLLAEQIIDAFYKPLRFTPGQAVTSGNA